jgi:ubiquinone/menaquinone biosynthesis C-methylase UbiE
VNPDEAVLLWVDEYSRMAEVYEAGVVPRFAPFTARLVERANIRPNTTVLDLSTGTGAAALLAAKAVGGTGLVVGIDLADGALSLAQTKASRAGLRNLRFEMLDSRNIVYRGGMFDTAITSFGMPSIGHEQVLREVCRVLKEGASFHTLAWGPREAGDEWDAFDEVLARHRTGNPSKTLAQLRAASDLLAASPDLAAVRDPATFTAKGRAAGFAEARAEPYVGTVLFGGVDDYVAFRASWGTTERELSEMGATAKGPFRTDLEARLDDHRQDDGLSMRWSVVYYDMTK